VDLSRGKRHVAGSPYRSTVDTSSQCTPSSSALDSSFVFPLHGLRSRLARQERLMVEVLALVEDEQLLCRCDGGSGSSQNARDGEGDAVDGCSCCCRRHDRGGRDHNDGSSRIARMRILREWRTTRKTRPSSRTMRPL
jgi:hypothetical protein